jgi:hypothetical protein
MTMSTPERCLKCEWWNFGKAKCDRIFKARVRVAVDAGEIDLQTQPGVLPKDMEDDFASWLLRAIGDVIDAWPGWAEVKRMRDGNQCAGHKSCTSIREFGKLAIIRGGPSPSRTWTSMGCSSLTFRHGKGD